MPATKSAGGAQAQAQAQRTEEITQTASLELVKALLRVSIYHVTYLRGIFPDEHYKAVDMRNLDNMEIHMLMPKDAESERLVDWVEGGVAHALERRYLHKVFFGISRDIGGKDLLEEYVFSFSYDADGGVHMNAGGPSRSRSKEFSTRDAAPKGKGPTLTAVKYQVCRLMRMLVELTNTLEQVPEERYLFMKCTYTPDTPDEYEPPLFGPAEDGGIGAFSRMPFVMEVGKVDTRHIKVGLAVKTVLDNVDAGDDWEDGPQLPVADDNDDLFETTERPATTAGGGGAGASCGGATAGPEPSGASAPGRTDSAGDESMGAIASCAATKARPGNRGEVTQKKQQRPSSADELASSQDMATVRSWVLGRPSDQVHLLDALARFSAISTDGLDAIFTSLQQEGLLVPTGEMDSYRINKPAGAAAGGAAATPAAAAASEDDEVAHAMEGLRVGPVDSCRGGVHEAPGSQRTVSIAPKRKAAPAGGPAEAETEVMRHMDLTQPSQAGARHKGRKASFVTSPIAQLAKKRKGAAAAAPAAAAQADEPAGLRRSRRHR